MMSELNELYQQVILDHNKQPRNFRILECADHTAEGYNPLCGDRLKLYLVTEGDKIKDISFQGSGCAISKSSASLMTDSVKGKTKKEAQITFENFHEMISKGLQGKYDLNLLGKLTVFSGVSEYPTRIKCATLAWHTLRAALEESEKIVTTEDNV
ncbi:MAG: SUF system NifU family Fe-S cluster assembly protein [Chlamydiae bacterium]|nr:SUF system NifU family Fe-S cluster assembly protein [Chlamydiota bacterium]MBI3276269.1 SUF system NifU family Fe-S cluster assembly protein [Chlamydiota bacterium]